MRLAGTSLARVLAGLSLTIAAAALLLLFPGPVLAAPTLTVTAQKGVSLVDESEALTVEVPAGLVPLGPSAGPPAQESAVVTVVVHLSGPSGWTRSGGRARLPRM